jgi:hypothetical protein
MARGRFAALVEVEDDVTATDKFPVNEDLRERWPLRKLRQVLTNFWLCQHIDMMKLGAAGS